MKLSIGIVGLPNVGKSTLFKILTKKEVNIANYPFATIDPNIGIVEVPDERLIILSNLSHSKKTIPAVVEFYDIAGLVKGAYKGEGLGNQFLAHIRNVNLIVHLVRCFLEEEIIHIEGDFNPLRDIEIIELELIFKDLEVVERRLLKAESEARSGKKELIVFRDKLKKLKSFLEQGNLLFKSKEDLIYYEEIIKELNLLTAKPQLFLLNGKKENIDERVIEKIKALKTEFLVINLKDENNLKDIDVLIQKAYQHLELISFFTTGEDETRAWTVKKGTKLPQAAGVIHSDFEKKFIRAEVINWRLLVKNGGWLKAKQKGLIRIEGKNYLVQDGDVLVVHHS